MVRVMYAKHMRGRGRGKQGGREREKQGETHPKRKSESFERRPLVRVMYARVGFGVRSDYSGFEVVWVQGFRGGVSG